MAKEKRYTCTDIAKELHRSEGAVVRRLNDLGIKGGFIKQKAAHYSQEELDSISDLIVQGYTYSLISQKTGRSEKSLQGMIFQRFGSENIDKARNRILSGDRLEAKTRTRREALDAEN